MGIFTGMPREDLETYISDARSFLRGTSTEGELKSIWAEDRRMEFFQMNKSDLRRNLSEAESELERLDGSSQGGAISVSFGGR